jgi:hypothetical protein
VDPATVLDGLLRDPLDLGLTRTVEVGRAGDLVLLHAPLVEVLGDPHQDAVRLTVLRGQVVTGA